jgi:hypothetical protein
MPYVPSTTDELRLRNAIDRAGLSEFERVLWFIALFGWLMLDGLLIAGRTSWIGIVGAIGAFAVMYWRLRGGYLSEEDPELHGVGLRTERQRAFTALMLRQALTGRNPLRPRVDHDPMKAWAQRVERTEAPVEEA